MRESDRLDAIAVAIASAPRRTILERLAEGPATMSQLADLLGVSLAGVTKHLEVLLDAQLVHRAKRGRTVTVELVPGSLEPLQEWATSTRLVWSTRLDRLVAYLSPAADEAARTRTPPPMSRPG
ncbi:MAG: metalloregulator ArsR/SmtB family transcription factor [Tetrasphaera sp.]